MTVAYDNWERLVAAVIKKQQLWELCHEQSRSPSVSSESSGFSFSFHLSSMSLDDDASFSFTSPQKLGALHLEEDDDRKHVPDHNPSLSLHKDHLAPVLSTLSNKKDTSSPSRKRNLKIEVPPKTQLQNPVSSDNNRNLSPKPTTPLHWPDDEKRQSHPLPLPPGSNSSSRPSSAATSPSTPSRSPERVTSSQGKRWKKGKLIGESTFGKIYIGFCSETGGMCAMKEVELIDLYAEMRAKVLVTEIFLLSSLSHPNIVRYYGSETIGENFYIYTEYVPGGSICNILQEYGKLGEPAIRSYTQQLLSVLSYLHSKSITHGDLKGENILVDPNGMVKLGNFGIEKNIARKSSPMLHWENPYWMAPEVIMNPNSRSRAIDIWSLGCTIIEMATSKSPWSEYKEGLALFKIINKELPTIPDYFSDECKDFLSRCLQRNPLHRATVFQLLEHPFVLKTTSPLEKKSSTPLSQQANSNELDSKRFPNHSPATPKSIFNDSDLYTPTNLSSPGSPVLSPLPRPCSPQQQQRLSPPTKSSPHTTSGSYLQLNKQKDTFPNSTTPNYSNSMKKLAYWDPKIIRGTQLDTSVLDDFDYDRVKQFKGASYEQIHDQSVLAYRVSQKLLQDHPPKSKPSLDLGRSSQLPSHFMDRVKD